MTNPEIIVERKKYGSSAAMDYTIRVYQKLDEETIMIDGVRYQKVEEQKPQILLDIIREWWVQDWTSDSEEICKELVNRIVDWLPTERFENGDNYNVGWNDCLDFIRDKIK